MEYPSILVNPFLQSIRNRQWNNVALNSRRPYS